MLIYETENRELWEALIADQELHAQIGVIRREQVVHLQRWHTRKVEALTFTGSLMTWDEIEAASGAIDGLPNRKGLAHRADDYILFYRDNLKENSPLGQQTIERHFYDYDDLEPKQADDEPAEHMSTADKAEAVAWLEDNVEGFVIDPDVEAEIEAGGYLHTRRLPEAVVPLADLEKRLEAIEKMLEEYDPEILSYHVLLGHIYDVDARTEEGLDKVEKRLDALEKRFDDVLPTIGYRLNKHDEILMGESSGRVDKHLRKGKRRGRPSSVPPIPNPSSVPPLPKPSSVPPLPKPPTPPSSPQIEGERTIPLRGEK